jgi:hypothetical protein
MRTACWPWQQPAHHSRRSRSRRRQQQQQLLLQQGVVGGPAASSSRSRWRLCRLSRSSQAARQYRLQCPSCQHWRSTGAGMVQCPAGHQRQRRQRQQHVLAAAGLVPPLVRGTLLLGLAGRGWRGLLLPMLLAWRSTHALGATLSNTLAPHSPHTEMLWVEKYKPHCAADLVGNPGNVETLRQWLYQWEDVHLRGAIPQQPRGSVRVCACVCVCVCVRVCGCVCCWRRAE